MFFPYGLCFCDLRNFILSQSHSMFCFPLKLELVNQTFSGVGLLSPFENYGNNMPRQVV